MPARACSCGAVYRLTCNHFKLLSNMDVRLAGGTWSPRSDATWMVRGSAGCTGREDCVPVVLLVTRPFEVAITQLADEPSGEIYPALERDAA